jgi:hypothetical protein
MYFNGLELTTCNQEEEDDVFEGYGEGCYDDDEEEKDYLELHDPFTGRYLKGNPLNKTLLDKQELENILLRSSEDEHSSIRSKVP